MASHRFSLYRTVAAVGLLMLASGPAMASDAEPPQSRITRLTPAQKAELLDAGTEDSADRAQARALGGGAPDRRIHGEVGAMIGTGGARGFFGTAVIPLGDTGTAVLSFENSRFGRRR